MKFLTGLLIGDLMYLEFFGKPTVVINSQSVARELLEKRGAKYSDRPRMVTLVEMCVRCQGGQKIFTPTGTITG